VNKLNNKNLIKILFVLSIVMFGISGVTAGLFDFADGGDALKGSGEYIVGQDIPAGEYYVKCTGYNLYVEDSSDSSGELNSIIFNLNTQGGAYITVKDGEYLTIQGGDLYELDKAPSDKTEDGYYKDGMFKVGTDIPAGEYNVEAEDMGYIEVSKNSRHQLLDIVTNDNFEGNKHITVKEGQYLTLANGAQIPA
jgi:hypothetical protein